MFNAYPINTLEVNGSTQLPDAPVLSIDAGEDSNTLTWNTPYRTEFHNLYWSTKPFENITDPGVHVFDETFGIATPPDGTVSYVHEIPGAYSLSLLYYRVSAKNRVGEVLSNQVDNWNFKLAIYQALYNKTLEELTLRFTPEIRRQYEESILWRSFVQSLCSELAQSRFEIKEALKQLNLQKAVDVFLNMWNEIIGISRINVNGIIETDTEYRQRLIDNVFWDKISNNALKKTMLLKLGYDSAVIDEGVQPTFFRQVPELVRTVYQATYGPVVFPMSGPQSVVSTHGNMPIIFIRTGPNSKATANVDDGTTLTFINYDYEYEGTVAYSASSFIQFLPGGFGGASWTPPASYPALPSGGLLYISAALTTQPPLSDSAGPDTVIHGPVGQYLEATPATATAGDALYFWPSGAQGTLVSFGDGIINYNLSPGSTTPQKYDWITNRPKNGNWILTGTPAAVTSSSLTIRPKGRLSNIYSVDLGALSITDADRNRIYDEISPLGAVGNVLIEILQDISTSFDDWDLDLGNIPYGPIFMGGPTQDGITVKSTESNWSIGSSNSTTITTAGSGYWTCPPGVHEITVTVRAPGGAGASSGSSWQYGAGGGGGGCARKTFTVEPGVQYPYYLSGQYGSSEYYHISTFGPGAGSGGTDPAGVGATRGGNAYRNTPGAAGSGLYGEFNWGGGSGTAGFSADDWEGGLQLNGGSGGTGANGGGAGGTGALSEYDNPHVDATAGSSTGGGGGGGCWYYGWSNTGSQIAGKAGGDGSIYIEWTEYEEVIVDNQRTMDGSNKFYGNDGPDDIVIMKRTS